MTTIPQDSHLRCSSWHFFVACLNRDVNTLQLYINVGHQLRENDDGYGRLSMQTKLKGCIHLFKDGLHLRNGGVLYQGEGKKC